MVSKTKAKAKKKKATCVNPDCRSVGARKEEYIRGLCDNCYRALRRLIQSGKVKDIKEAEDLGLCRVPKEPGSDRFPVFANRRQSTAR